MTTAPRKPESKRERQRVYFREYMREYRLQQRAGAPRIMDTCPSCGRRKAARYAHCGRCDERLEVRIVPRPSSKPARGCPFCAVPMRVRIWHGRKYVRCPNCGLELRRPGIYETEEEAA